MTKKELIDLLADCPDDTLIEIYDDCYGEYRDMKDDDVWLVDDGVKLG